MHPSRGARPAELAGDRVLNGALQQLLEAGVRDDVFPAAQASVFHRGQEVARAAVGAGQDTPFDLASLTKILCTATTFVALWGEGKVGPSTPVSRWIDGSPLAKNGATLGDLLAHRSGLPAWQPLFAVVLHTVPELRRSDCPASTRLTVRSEVRDAAARSPLDVPPGTRTLYSDIGFLLAGEMLAEAAGAPLDAVHARIGERLGIATHFHRLSTRGQDSRDPCGGRWDALPPTGSLRPRPPAPGQENRWESLPSDPSRPGEVDDDNAWVMDGVSGHAGLFGTATEVAQFGHRVLEELGGAGRVAPAELWERMVTPSAGNARALGFDTPSGESSAAGQLIGRTPPGAFGHLGYTGTSLWVDRARALSVALLTNRTALGRDNVRIQAFRPAFHDAVLQALGLR
ncbi:MAG TPA: serine hydrolase domain-containing protein [Myxococcaceae bacterium]|nr:serine hydrolase domain-containing protein [Myxococcaceae bacterium]